MKENLRSTAYASQSNVIGFTPTYVVYPNIPFTFGYLYTWYSAVGLPEGSNATPPTAISERVQGICPNEWAMPSTTQLAALYAAGEPRANDVAYWVYGSAVAPSGTNGFNMLPAGYYNAQTQNFYEYKLAGYLWALNYNGATSSCGVFPFDCRSTSNITMNKYNMLSVRCVKAPPYGVEEVTACNSYTWNGNTYDVTGRYVANLPNDSVSTLLLTINYTTYGTLNILACDSYYWDLTEQTYTTSGTHMATIENYLGCDSIVTLNLEVRYSNTGIDVQNHCDAYEWIDGITYFESTNTPTFVVTNAAGCDSTVTLNLTIRKMTTGVDVQNHCDTYTWIDGNTYNESSNDNTYTLTNAAGCDSVVTLNLTIRNKTYGIDVQNHCDTYTWINGITYTESTNTPVYTITNAAGCDSIVTLNLTIRKKTASPSVSLTEYNTFTWNGVTYTTSGIYTATLTNAVGCDSTATLDLTILYRFPIDYVVNQGIMPAEYPVTYIQGVGATLPIPTRLNHRFDGWYDNATFTGSPITAVSNTESGNKQFWALWTLIQIGSNSNLTFAGNTTSVASIPNASELNPTTAITLEAWIFPTVWRASSFQGSIIAKEQATGNGGYVLRCGSSGTLNFAVGIGTGFQEVTATGLVLNQWQHVAATYDGTTMRIFRNGVQIGSKAQTGTINVSTNPIEIGRNPQYTDRFFQGRIDEARIFNVALDAATLLTWYNKSVTSSHSNYSNLVAYYEMDNITTPANLVPTVGPAGTVAVATYVSGANCNFTSNSPYITPVSSVKAIHPTASLNSFMLPVAPGDTLAQVLRVEVEALFGGNLTQIVLSTNGTTNPADLLRARLYYTGTSTTFSTTTQFGTPILNPNGTLTFTGNQTLPCGITYFWLTYDISPTATYNNVVDASLISSVVERLAITPINGSPTGDRLIVNPCTYHILQIRDTQGDSWTGTRISVLKNNDTIFSNISVLEGPGTDRFLYQNFYNFPFNALPGDSIRVIRVATGALGASECRVRIIRGSGTVVLSEVTVATPPAVNLAVAGCFVTITASAGSNGTISPTGAVNAYINLNRTFTFTPSANYYVDSVLVNGINIPSAVLAGNYTFINVTAPQTIRVIFKTNVITASTGLYGTISPTGNVNVGKNGTQKFTFVPATHCFLDSIIVNGVNIPDSIAGKSFTFTNVNEPHTIRSVYRGNIIFATAGPNGTISSPGGTPMAPNSSRVYTMTPNTNYWLDSLIVNGINRPDSIPARRFTFNNVNESHTIRVVFRTNTITASTGPNGTISPLGVTNRLPNTSQKYTITPNANYFLDSLIVNGINIPDSIPGKSFTFTNINANHTIRVVFRTNIIISSTGPNGTISPLGTTNKDNNTSQKYTITPNQFYFLDSLLVNEINIPDSIPGNSFTFNNINSNNTIRVVFKTNYITPTLITPPTIVGTPTQYNILSTLTLNGGLVQHNGIDVPGTFTWTTPTTILNIPNNYSVTFTPTDILTYFPITFNVYVNFSFSHLVFADGTITNNQIPFEGYWLDAVQRNQVIYPASMLTPMVGRVITSMSFYFSVSPASAWTAVATFKLGSTTTTNLTAGLEPAPATTVYTGTMTVVGGILTLNFTQPFTYTGDNLLLEFNNATGNYVTSTLLGVTQTAASRYTRGSTNTLINFLPKTKFELVP